MKPRPDAKRPTCLSTIVRGLAGIRVHTAQRLPHASLPVRVGPMSCQLNAAHRTRNFYSALCCQVSGHRGLPTCALLVCRFCPSPFGQACAAKFRSRWPLGRTSVLSDKTHGNCGVRNWALVDTRLQATPWNTRPICDEDVSCHPNASLSAKPSAKAALTPEQMQVGCILRRRARRPRGEPVGSTNNLVKAACGPAGQASTLRSVDTWVTTEGALVSKRDVS